MATISSYCFKHLYFQKSPVILFGKKKRGLTQAIKYMQALLVPCSHMPDSTASPSMPVHPPWPQCLLALLPEQTARAQPLVGLSGDRPGGGARGAGMKCLRVIETQGSEGLHPQQERCRSLGTFIQPCFRLGKPLSLASKWKQALKTI